MKKAISWILVVVGIFAFISGVGYFVAVYINYGQIYLTSEFPAITQIIISVLSITYGVMLIRNEKKNSAKT